MVCQPEKRMHALDHTFDILDDTVPVKFLVPKFHLPVHVAACRTKFSFNLTKGVGRTMAKPERVWSEADPLAPSTKEMGPGSRRDTLDFHFGDSNWRKFTGLGVTLMRRLKAATADMTEYVASHQDLEASLPAASLSLWRGELDAWEDDPSLRNPFEVVSKTPTQASVRRELSEAEARDLATGKDVSLDENVSPSVLISAGMDLEADSQSWFRQTMGSFHRSPTKPSPNTHQHATKKNRELVQDTPDLYPPRHYASPEIKHGTGSGGLKPEDTTLWLPSQIGESAAFDKHLAEIEWKLRIGQAYESLDELRNSLRIQSHLFKFKDKFIRGQASNTRARNSISLIQARVDAAGEEYRAARLALVALAKILGKIGWQDRLPILADSDKREISEGEFGISDGKQKLSWIWKSLDVAEGGDDNLRDALRIEWCKSRARAMRFREEVELLLEEMRRVQRFLVWQEEFWARKGDVSAWGDNIHPMRAEGLRAYANRQAALRHALRDHFGEIWKFTEEYVALTKSAIKVGGTDSTSI
ncbi:hypothetical protein BD779DRAFT_1679267 [Infundibulicybe gibba]|nr:hypothetical protein BD779DRAFT_1679267 [Infundibulicybe gibba]